MFNMAQKIPDHKLHDEQPNLMTVKGEVIKIIPEDTLKSMMMYSRVLDECQGNTFDPNIQSVIHLPRKVSLALKVNVNWTVYIVMVYRTQRFE